MAVLWCSINKILYHDQITNLIGPLDSSALGISTVMVFVDALELIWCNTAVWESNDGAIE